MKVNEIATYLNMPLYHCYTCGMDDIHSHRDLGDCEPLVEINCVLVQYYHGPSMHLWYARLYELDE